VDTLPGLVCTPRLRAGLGVGQVGEVLAGEEVAPHVLDHAFDPRFVARVGHPGRVGEKSASLRVLRPSHAELRIGRIGLGHNRCHVVGDQHLEHTAEESPGRLAAGDDRLQGLVERQPHEHVPRVDGGEDQRVHDPVAPRFGIEDLAHLPEIDLAFHAGFAVGDRHRASAAAAPVGGALRAVPMQGPLRHHDAAARQQIADLDHR